MIPDMTIGALMIDCENAQRAGDFYAGVLDIEKATAYGCPAITPATA